MVSFANEADEGVPADATLASMKGSNLTKSSKAWDLDGDGQLDEAELALKALDKDKTGTLSKEEMYKLMETNLAQQRDMFKMKKVVMALVAITLILALSNLGTAFAAAYLAKDTTTSQSVMVDKATGEAVRTDLYSHLHQAGEAMATQLDDDDCQSNTEGTGINCVIRGQMVDNAEAMRIINECEAGSDVSFQFETEKGLTSNHHICPPTGEADYVPCAEPKVVDGVTYEYCEAKVISMGYKHHIHPAKDPTMEHYHLAWTPISE